MSDAEHGGFGLLTQLGIVGRKRGPQLVGVLNTANATRSSSRQG